MEKAVNEYSNDPASIQHVYDTQIAACQAVRDDVLNTGVKNINEKRIESMGQWLCDGEVRI